MKPVLVVMLVLLACALPCCGGGRGGGDADADATGDADAGDGIVDVVEEDLPDVPGNNPVDPDIPQDDLSGGTPPAGGTCPQQGLDELCRRRDLAPEKPWQEVVEDDGWSQPETLVFHDVVTGAEIIRMTDDPVGSVIHCHINRSTFNADGSMLSFGSRRCWPDTYCPDNFRYVVETHGRGPHIIEVPRLHMLWTGPWEGWSPTDPDVFHFVNHGDQNGLWRVSVDDGAFDTDLVMELPDPDRRKHLFGGVAPDGTLAIKTTNLADSDVIVYVWNPDTPTELTTFDLILGVVHPDHSESEEWHLHDFTLRRNAQNTVVFNYGPQGSSGEPLFIEMATDGSGGWRVSYAPNEDVHCPVPYYSHPAWNRDGSRVVFNGTQEKYVDGTNPDGSPRWTWNDSEWGGYVHEVSPFDPADEYATSDLVAKVADLDLRISHYAWDGYDDRWAHGSASTTLGDDVPLHRLATDGSLTEPVVYMFSRSHCTDCDYCSLPRPAQSPDATKVIYASDMLQSGENVQDIYLAVHRYPFAPVWLGLASGDELRLTWRFHDLSREIRGVRVFRSPDSSPLAFEDVSGVVEGSSYLDDHEIPDGGSVLYAVTAVEHSGLESRVLSRIVRVTREGSTYRVDQHEPYGTSGFDLEAPGAPTDLSASTATGGMLLSWSPPTDGDVRLFHVYASPTGDPDTTQAHRIASLPASHPAYLDWSHGPETEIHYAVTAVDYQGNESDPVRD